MNIDKCNLKDKLWSPAPLKRSEQCYIDKKKEDKPLAKPCLMDEKAVVVQVSQSDLPSRQTQVLLFPYPAKKKNQGLNFKEFQIKIKEQIKSKFP